MSKRGAANGMICLLFDKALFNSLKHTNLEKASIILFPTAW